MHKCVRTTQGHTPAVVMQGIHFSLMAIHVLVCGLQFVADMMSGRWAVPIQVDL